MKRLLALVLLFSCSGLAQSSSAPGASQNAAPFALDHFYMVLMRRAPSAPSDEDKVKSLWASDTAYWQQIASRGDLILGGPILEMPESIDAAMIYRASDAAAAAQIAQHDPLVAAHLWSAEVHPWLTKKDYLKPQHTYYGRSKTYYLGLLLRGPKFSPEDSPERQKIQEGHMANIKRLSDMGKLVVAGPFEEDGNLRGIFVFRTATMQEALDLTNTDPAVQAGRLRVELHPWDLPADAFAEN